MVLLSAGHLTKSYGEHVLFEDVSFHMEENDRVGLVGANGTGKTTLFKMITGEESADSGEIGISKTASLGYMAQHISLSMERTVLEELLSGFTELKKMEQKLHQIHDRLEAGETSPQLIQQQHELDEAFRAAGGLTYQSRARSALLGLGLKEEDLSRPIGTLSGGERSKVSLARLLVCGAKLLLLDEPTNHLDIQSVEWLEEFLLNYNGAFLVISHDRYFLDRVTRRTFVLRNQRLHAYAGGYTAALQAAEEEKKIERRHYDNQMKEVRRIEGIIEQQRRWNRERNIKTAESKQKMIDRIKRDMVEPERDEQSIRFALKAQEGGGNDVLIAERLKKSFASPLFENVSLHIRKDEKVFLLGANGCGKTTLLKILQGTLPADSGTIRRGVGVMPGYYDQTQAGLHPEKTALNEIWDSFPRMTETEVRSALAVFLFMGDTVFKQVSLLSGGEKARLLLLKLMLSKANFLILDEPTNHLDIGSREALEDALLDYGGTLLMVSHDRYFINKLADRILVLNPDGIEEYIGGYDEYAAKAAGAASSVQKSAPKQKKPNEYQLKKEAASQQRRLIGRISRLEKEIEEQEDLIERLQEEIAAPQTAADYQKLLDLTAQLEAERKRLEEQYELWGQLEEERDETAVLLS